MTPPPYLPSAPPRRPVDVLGIVAVCIAGVILVPTLLVLLVGLIPEMNAIWWLGIVLIPLMGIAGGLALILGIVGTIVAVRAGGRYVLSIIGMVLGLALLVPVALLFFGSTI